jgi:hypothetical protein
VGGPGKFAEPGLQALELAGIFGRGKFLREIDVGEQRAGGVNLAPGRAGPGG